MKTGKMILTSAIVGLLSIALSAADKDFWSAKSYTEWSKKEVEKLLKNSPWTKSVHVSALALGGRSNMSRQRISGVSPGSGNTGGATPDVSTPDVVLYISWYARPTREALARQTMLENPQATPEEIQRILRHEAASYDFIVAGLPARFIDVSDPEALDKLKEQTYLLKKNKERIPAMSVMQSGGRRLLIFSFSNAGAAGDAITMQDKEITLVTDIEGTQIRTSFKLADMVIRGKLEI